MGTAYPYLRVSSDDQMVSTQMEQIRRYWEVNLKPKGLVLGEPWADEDVSGGTKFTVRPAASRLMLKVDRGDAIVFSKLDRGFRNTRDCLEVVETLKARQVELHILDLIVHDLSSSMGYMALVMAAAFAEFERRRMCERMVDCGARRRQMGLAWTSNLRGFKLDGPKGRRRFVPDPNHLKDAEEVTRLRDEEGWTFQDIYFHFLRIRRVRRATGKEYKLSTIKNDYYWLRDERLKEQQQRRADGTDLSVRRADESP